MAVKILYFPTSVFTIQLLKFSIHFRVRRDEAKAAEEEKELERRIKLADQESRMTLLRGMATNRMTEDQKAELSRLSEKASSSSSSQPERLEHVNFFSELEAGDVSMPNQNKDREAEQKREQEEWEKKVGILTYLGQDTNELTGEKSWWQKLPEKRPNKNVEEDTSDKKDAKQDKFKDLVDPLNNIRKYLGTEGVQGVIKKSDKKAIEQNDEIKNESRDKKRKRKRRIQRRRAKRVDIIVLIQIQKSPKNHVIIKRKNENVIEAHQVKVYHRPRPQKMTKRQMIKN